MKVFRYVMVLLSITIIMMLQACGNDTTGALTISSPAAQDNGDGTSIVTFTVTYAPPSGKTAQGVEVSVSINGLSFSTDKFTSLSNSFSYSVNATNSTLLSISASVNGMNSSRLFFVPVGGTSVPGALTVSPTTAGFIFTDTAGASKTITVSGGIAPYTVISSVPLDIEATMLTGTSVKVTLLNAATSPSPGTTANATVTVTDSSTPVSTRTIPVNYFK